MRTKTPTTTTITVQSRLRSLRDRVGLIAGVEEVSRYVSKLVIMGTKIYTVNYVGIGTLYKKLFEIPEISRPSPELVEKLYKQYEEILENVVCEILRIDSIDEAKRIAKDMLSSFIEALSELRSEKSDDISRQVEQIINVFQRFSKRIEDVKSSEELMKVLQDLEEEFRKIIENLILIYENLLYFVYTLYIATKNMHMKMFSALLYALRNLFKARISDVQPFDVVRGLSCLCTASAIALASHKMKRVDPKFYKYVAAYSLWSQAFMNAFTICERCSWLEPDRILDLFKRRKFAKSARLLDIAIFNDIGVECYRHLFSVLRIDLTQSLEEIREEERVAMLHREAEESGEEST